MVRAGRKRPRLCWPRHEPRQFQAWVPSCSPTAAMMTSVTADGVAMAAAAAVTAAAAVAVVVVTGSTAPDHAELRVAVVPARAGTTAICARLPQAGAAE